MSALWKQVADDLISELGNVCFLMDMERFLFLFPIH